MTPDTGSPTVRGKSRRESNVGAPRVPSSVERYCEAISDAESAREAAARALEAAVENARRAHVSEGAISRALVRPLAYERGAHGGTPPMTKTVTVKRPRIIELVVGPCTLREAEDCAARIQGFLDELAPELAAAVRLVSPSEARG